MPYKKQCWLILIFSGSVGPLLTILFFRFPEVFKCHDAFFRSLSYLPVENSKIDFGSSKDHDISYHLEVDLSSLLCSSGLKKRAQPEPEVGLLESDETSLTQGSMGKTIGSPPQSPNKRQENNDGMIGPSLKIARVKSAQFSSQSGHGDQDSCPLTDSE